MKYLKITALAVLCAVLSACSALDAVGKAAGVIASDSPSVEATAQVGRENVNEGDSVLDTRRVDARREDRRVDAVVEEGGVSNVTQTETRSESRNESGVSSGDWISDNIQVQQFSDKVLIYLLILFALGWILPSPADIFRGIGKGLIFLRDLILLRN